MSTNITSINLPKTILEQNYDPPHDAAIFLPDLDPSDRKTLLRYREMARQIATGNPNDLDPSIPSIPKNLITAFSAVEEYISPNRRDSESECKDSEGINFESEEHCHLLSVAIKLFDPKYDLSSLDEKDRITCLHLFDNAREQKLRTEPFHIPEIDERLKTGLKIPGKARKFFRVFDGTVSLFKLCGILPEDKPLGKSDFYRLFPENGFRDELIPSLLNSHIKITEDLRTDLLSRHAEYVQTRLPQGFPQPAVPANRSQGSSTELLERVTSLEAGIASSKTKLESPSKTLTVEELKEVILLDRERMVEAQKIFKEAQQASKDKQKQKEAGDVIKGIAKSAYVYFSEWVRLQEKQDADQNFESRLERKKKQEEFRTRYSPISLPRMEQIYFERMNPLKTLLTAREMEVFAKKMETQYQRLIDEIDVRTNLNSQIDQDKSRCNQHIKDLHEWYQQRTRELDGLSSGLTAIKSWLTIIACIPNPVTAAVATAANMGAQAAGSAIDRKRAIATRDYQSGVSVHQQAQQNLSSVHSYNTTQIAGSNRQLAQRVHVLKANKDFFKPEEYRQQINEAHTDAEKKQVDLEAKSKKTEEAIAEKKKEIEALQAAKRRAFKREGSNNKKKSKAGKKERKKVAAKLDTATAELRALEARLPTEKQEVISHKEQVLDVAKKEIELEESVAHIRDTFHERVQMELDFWEPSGKSPEEVKANRKRREQIENEWSKWDRSRGTERALVKVVQKTTKGLASELGHCFNSDRPGIALDLLGEGYHLYDLGKDLNVALDTLGLGIDKFLKAYNEKGKEGITEQFDASVFKKVFEENGLEGVIDEVGGVVLFTTKFLVPTLQAATAFLACIRLAKSLTKKRGGLTPQQKFYVEMLNKAFSEYKEYVDERLKSLEGKIGEHQSQLKRTISTLKNDLISVSNEIVEEVRETAKETQEVTKKGDYERFITGIHNQKPKIRAIPLSSIEVALEQLTLKLDRIELPVNNGFIPGNCDTKDGRDIKLVNGAQFMRRNPECFTGLLAKKVGIEDVVPNWFLYREIAAQLLKLKALDVKAPPQLKLKLHLFCQRMLESGRVLQLLFARTSPLLENTVIQREAIQEKITTNLIRMKQLRQQRSRRQAPCTAEDLKKKREFLLGKYFVGDSKFRLSKIVTEQQVFPQITLALNGKDSEIKATFTAGFGGTVGVGVTGFAGLLGAASVIEGTATVAALVAAGPALAGLFAVSAAFGAVGGVGIMAYEKLTSAMTPSDFYSRVEAEICTKMQMSIKQLLQERIISTNQQLTDAAQSTTSGLRSITILSGYDPENNRFHPPRFVYESPNLSSPLVDAPEYPEDNRPLLVFKTTCKLGDLTLSTEIDRTSLLQERDIQRIQPMQVEGYNEKVQKLTSHYYDYLANQYHGTELATDNLYRELSAKSELIPSSNPILPDLLFPKKFLQYINHRFKHDGGKMEKVGAGTLIPRYDFVQSEDKQSWRLIIRSCCTASQHSDLEEHGEIEVARFDNQTVEAFRKTSFKKDGSDKSRYTRGPINKDEFLIQMMHSGLIEGVGLPGSDSHTVAKTGWVNAVDRPFVGLYKLLETVPEFRVTFNSAEYTNDEKLNLERIISTCKSPNESTKTLKKDPIVNYGQDYATIWRRIRTKEKEMLQDHRNYEEQYHILIAAYKLVSGMDFESFDHLIRDRLGLVPPESLDKLVDLTGDDSFFGSIDDVSNLLQKLPGPQQDELDQLLEDIQLLQESLGVKEQKKSETSSSNASPAEPTMPGGIANGGNTCYLASALQTISVIPELRQLFTLEDNRVSQLGHGILTRIEKGLTVSKLRINQFRDECRKARLVSTKVGMEDAQEFLGKLVEHLGTPIKVNWERKEVFTNSPYVSRKALSANEVSKGDSSINELAQWRAETTSLELSPSDIETDMQTLINQFWSPETIEMSALKEENDTVEKVTGNAVRSKKPVLESFPSVISLNVKQLPGGKYTATNVETIYPAGDKVGPKYRLASIIVHPQGHYYTVQRLADGCIVKADDSYVEVVDSMEGYPGCGYTYMRMDD